MELDYAEPGDTTQAMFSRWDRMEVERKSDEDSESATDSEEIAMTGPPSLEHFPLLSRDTDAEEDEESEEDDVADDSEANNGSHSSIDSDEIDEEEPTQANTDNEYSSGGESESDRSRADSDDDSDNLIPPAESASLSNSNPSPFPNNSVPNSYPTQSHYQKKTLSPAELLVFEAKIRRQHPVATEPAGYVDPSRVLPSSFPLAPEHEALLRSLVQYLQGTKSITPEMKRRTLVDLFAGFLVSGEMMQTSIWFAEDPESPDALYIAELRLHLVWNQRRETQQQYHRRLKDLADWAYERYDENGKCILIWTAFTGLPIHHELVENFRRLDHEDHDGGVYVATVNPFAKSLPDSTLPGTSSPPSRSPPPATAPHPPPPPPPPAASSSSTSNEPTFANLLNSPSLFFDVYFGMSVATAKKLVTKNRDPTVTIAENALANFLVQYCNSIPLPSKGLVLGGPVLRIANHLNFLLRGKDLKKLYRLAFSQDRRLEAPATDAQVAFFIVARVPPAAMRAEVLKGWTKKGAVSLLESQISLRAAPPMGGRLREIAAQYDYSITQVGTQLNTLLPLASKPVRINKLFPDPIVRTLFDVDPQGFKAAAANLRTQPAPTYVGGDINSEARAFATVIDADSAERPSGIITQLHRLVSARVVDPSFFTSKFSKALVGLQEHPLITPDLRGRAESKAPLEYSIKVAGREFPFPRHYITNKEVASSLAAKSAGIVSIEVCLDRNDPDFVPLRRRTEVNPAVPLSQASSTTSSAIAPFIGMLFRPTRSPSLAVWIAFDPFNESPHRNYGLQARETQKAFRLRALAWDAACETIYQRIEEHRNAQFFAIEVIFHLLKNGWSRKLDDEMEEVQDPVERSPSE